MLPEQPLAAGSEIGFRLHRQGEQGQGGLKVGLAGEGLQIHPGHILLEEAPQQQRPPGPEGQEPVGQEHHHPQVFDPLLLLNEPKGFRPEAALEAPVWMHLHLQEHHRKPSAATGVVAGPEHAIGMVGHLFEGDRPEAVGRFGVPIAWPGGGQPRQELPHQIGQGAEHLGVPVIAGQGSWEG